MELNRLGATEIAVHIRSFIRLLNSTRTLRNPCPQTLVLLLSYGIEPIPRPFQCPEEDGAPDAYPRHPRPNALRKERRTQREGTADVSMPRKRNTNRKHESKTMEMARGVLGRVLA